MSTLEYIEFHLADSVLKIETVLRQGIDNLFFPQIRTSLSWGQWLRTQPRLTARMTRRALLQQLQCLSVRLKHPVCWEVAFLEAEQKQVLTTFGKNRLNHPSSDVFDFKSHFVKKFHFFGMVLRN